MFIQCVIQKLPHLLAADVMHFLPLDYEAHHWEEWEGHLVKDIDHQISSFLSTLLEIPSLPVHALNIAQLTIGSGGLSILNASARAVPDFALTMAKAMRCASAGFRFSVDLQPHRLDPTLTNLFLPAQNPKLVYLQRFELLLPSIAAVACSDTCQVDERINHF